MTPRRGSKNCAASARASAARCCASVRAFRSARKSGVLVVAAEPAGPNLSFNERVRRLIAGLETPLAAFAADGTLIHANESGAPLLAGRTTLNELRGSGDAAIETIGEGGNAFTLARFHAAQAGARARRRNRRRPPISRRSRRPWPRGREARSDNARRSSARTEPSEPARAAGQRTRATKPPSLGLKPNRRRKTCGRRCKFPRLHSRRARAQRDTRTPASVAFRLADGCARAASASPPANSWK